MRISKKWLRAAVALLALAVVGVFLIIGMTTGGGASTADGELPVFAEVFAPSSGALPEPSPPSAPSAPASEKTAVPPSLEPSTPIESEPARVLIPAIGADAELIGTERDEKAGSMAIYPSADAVSWYRERPVPGNTGNAILAGHNKWKGKKGTLADLGALAVGDEMTIVYQDGSERSFFLESVFEYAFKTASAEEIMRADGPARVTVITCSGAFNTKMGTSENRLVAVFRPAEGFVTPDPPVTPIPAVSAPQGKGL